MRWKVNQLPGIVIVNDLKTFKGLSSLVRLGKNRMKRSCSERSKR